MNFSYTYDALGNPLSRADGNTGVAETFAYDTLNRLTSSSVNLSPTPLVKNFTYDSIGNLLTKSDVGSYSYPAPGQARPHAVLSIAGDTVSDTVSATFSYDANGNQTGATGIGRTRPPAGRARTPCRVRAYRQMPSQIASDRPNALRYYVGPIRRDTR